MENSTSNVPSSKRSSPTSYRDPKRVNSFVETVHDIVDLFRGGGGMYEEDTTKIAKTRMAKEKRLYHEGGRDPSCPTRNARIVLESYKETL